MMTPTGGEAGKAIPVAVDPVSLDLRTAGVREDEIAAAVEAVHLLAKGGGI